MDLGLKGRAVAVSAASKGFGRACAEEFAREGADLAICARGEDTLRQAQKELEAAGARVRATPLDLVEPGACERFVDEAAEAYGRLDVIVSNIGGPVPGPFESQNDDEFRRILEQNLMCAVRLARSAIPHMRRGGYGRIIFITSASVKQPWDGLITGNTARGGMAGFAKTLSNELAPAGITVNTIAPGSFLTDRAYELAKHAADRAGITVEQALEGSRASIPMGRIGDPKELAALAAFLAGERASFMTGTTIQVDGGTVRSLL